MDNEWVWFKFWRSLKNCSLPSQAFYEPFNKRFFLLDTFEYIFGFSFVVWRCFFFTLLSYTLTGLWRPYQDFVSSIDLDPAAILVPVAYFFDKLVIVACECCFCCPVGLIQGNIKWLYSDCDRCIIVYFARGWIEGWPS